jgi:hypothetical protein
MLFKGLTPSFSTNFQVLFALCELFQLLLLPFQLHLERLLFFIKFLNFFYQPLFLPTSIYQHLISRLWQLI